MHSCLFEGWVQHRRHQPVQHQFRYPLYMLYFDLDELETVFAGAKLWSTSRPAPMWLRRRDHVFNNHRDEPLRETIEEIIHRSGRTPPAGAIRMLTGLRCMGFLVNPVTFFYCFNKDNRLETVVAEVQNTPWRERHCYVLDPFDRQSTSPKVFHVSPFMPMELRYRWRITEPASGLTVRIENLPGAAGSPGDTDHEPAGAVDNRTTLKPVFDATLHMKRSEITAGSLNRLFWRRPMMTWRVAAGIYWQAFRLWRKSAPFHKHPGGAPPHRIIESAPVRRVENNTMVTHGNSSR